MSEVVDAWEDEARRAGELAGDMSQEAEREEGGLPPIVPLDLADVPPLRPELIEGVLRQGHVAMLGGPSKAGKTQSLVELAVAIAAGGTWFGLRCEKGRVLYIDGETDPASFAHRFRGVADRLAADHACVKASVDVWILRGKSRPLGELAGQIADRASGKGYNAVILDPAYPFMDGDENSAGDVRSFCNAITEVSDRLGCSVIYDHHHSKGAQGDKASIDRVSGSGMFSRHADAIVDMVELVPAEGQEAESGATAFRVSATLREFAPMRPFNVWFRHPVHVRDYDGALDDWEPMTAARAGGKATGGKAKLQKLGNIAVMERAADEMRDENGGQPIPFRDLVRRCGCSDNTLRTYLKESLRYRRESGPNSCFVVPRDM